MRSGKFTIEEAALAGLHVLAPDIHRDDRGAFERIFCERDLATVLAGRTIRQINRSETIGKGAVRGMHFQRPPMTETKIVSCLHGRVYDVAVDVRTNSPTFLRWFGVELCHETRKAFFISEGFAHGFQLLSDRAELLYLHSEFYSPEAEGALNAADPRIAIEWPLPISLRSLRDEAAAMIDDHFLGIDL